MSGGDRVGDLAAPGRAVDDRVGPRGFSSVDDVLFDVDALVSTTRDVRSVAEMLLDVDHQARQLLIDVDGDAAAGLVRGWSPMVQTAAALLAALPNNESRHGPPPQVTEVIERLLEHALVGADALGRGWPGPGPVDARIADSTMSLRRAGELVRRYSGEIPTETHEARDDLSAARARVVHGLYVTAHAINVSLLAHGRDLVAEDHGDRRRLYLSSTRTAYAVKPLAGWVDRITTAEMLGHQYLTGKVRSRLAVVTHDDHDPGRIARALANWDIQAHRTLTCGPTATNVVLVARVQALQMGVTQLLADAAGTAPDHVVQPGAGDRPVTSRLGEVLRQSGGAWQELASRWDDLPSPTDRPDERLLRAAAEIRASFRTLTHDDITSRRPEAMAMHADFQPSLRAALTSVQTAPALAELIATIADHPDLVGRARAMSRRSHDDVERGFARPPGGDADIAWVSPVDIVAKRLIPLPGPVIDGLQRASRSAESTSLRAAAAAAIDDVPGLGPAPSPIGPSCTSQPPPPTTRFGHSTQCSPGRQ